MRRILLALCAIGFIASDVLASPTIRTVAMLGQQAPGTSAGVLYSSFGERPPAINNSGQVAFRGFLAGGGADSTNTIGIWSEANGPLELVARSGSQVPSLPAGVTYFDIGYPFISDSGTTAAQGFFQGSGVNTENNAGYITSFAGASSVLARKGDQAPGMASGVTFRERGEPLLNSDGKLAFNMTTLANSGIWSEATGTLSPVALSGMQAPGLPIGTNFGSFGIITDGGFNTAGQIVFSNAITPRGGPFGIWTAKDGSTILVAVSGQQAAGLPAGTTLLGGGGPSLNSAGQILYSGRFSDGDSDLSNDYGVWLFDNGSTELIVRSGGQAPGLPAGITMQGLSGSALSEQGHIMITGTLAGAGVTTENSVALWKRDNAGLIHLLAREGEQAVGLPAGFTYGKAAPESTIISSNRTINSMGNVAFHLLYNSTPSGSSARSGIWAQDINGNLQLIAAVGFPLEIAPGDTRIVRDLRFHGSGNNESGLRSGFNDRGQVAFWARFTDDSAGIFVSNLVAIPEPGTLALVGVPALGMLLRRR
jgi:hypothetical protein